MRVLVVGDTHGDMAWIARTVIPTAVAENCSRIMQLGDFGFAFTPDLRTARAELATLGALLVEANVDLTFLPGNHEHHPTLARLTEMSLVGQRVNADGHAELARRVHYAGRVSAWHWAGVRCAAVCGATSIDKDLRTPGSDWFPEEELSEAEVQRAIRLGEVDVLFSHDGPTNVPFNWLVDSQPSEIHRRRISGVAQRLQPTRWYHGHYHAHAVYRFPHYGGTAQVTALDCNNRPAAHSTAVLDLTDFARPTTKAPR
jgi:hypothetical protein